jgi:membrane associated rhomboid family serine protease
MGGTATLVIANFAVALVFGFVDPFFHFFKASPALDKLVLHFGAFNPLSWVTSAFVHGDIAHLAGNMIFLLTFGMIVEGEIGWRRFLGLYLGIAAVEGALEQLLLMEAEGFSYGASACIFGLIAIACVWAPRREVTVFYWVFRFVGTSDVKASSLALWWIGWELAYWTAFGFGLASSGLHLLGAGVGLAAGIVMLRLGLVDTGGEDAFALREAARVRRKKDRPFELPPVPRMTARDHLESFVQYALPTVAGSLIAVGLLIVYTTSWAESAAHDMAVAKTVFAFVLIGCGVATFRHWKNRS